MHTATLSSVLPVCQAHPNELDHRRIERALDGRKRYRYVSPRVLDVEGGYRIESPCCSRNIDPEGGVIDVALLLFDEASGAWQLFGKDHGRGVWRLHSTHPRLAELLTGLNADPERRFWQ
jgi:hypothetical protein